MANGEFVIPLPNGDKIRIQPSFRVECFICGATLTIRDWEKELVVAAADPATQNLIVCCLSHARDDREGTQEALAKAIAKHREKIVNGLIEDSQEFTIL